MPFPMKTSRSEAEIEVLPLTEFPDTTMSIRRSLCYRVISELKRDYKFEKCVKVPVVDNKLQANLHTYAKRYGFPVTTKIKAGHIFVARADIWRKGVVDQTNERGNDPTSGKHN